MTEHNVFRDTRQILPHRRFCEILDVEAGTVVPLTYTVQVGRYPDGRVGEVFIIGGRTGTDLDASARDAAIALSFALQCGADIERLRAAMTRRPDGTAEGPLGAALDAIAAMEGAG